VVVFEDPSSATECNVVNAANAQLVVLTETGELAVVSGKDMVLEGTFVDETGTVTFGEEAAGVLQFDTDGDGMRRLFWESITGRLITLEGMTGLPTESDVLPADIIDVSFDACDFWDNQDDCPKPEPVETTIVTQPQNEAKCVGERVSIFVEAVGDNIEGYQWYKSNEAIDGATGPILTFASLEVFDTAAYHVDVIDTDGSKITSDYAIIVADAYCTEAPPEGLGLCGPGLAMVTALTLAGLIGMGRVSRLRSGIRRRL